jgi:hypothetical protein
MKKFGIILLGTIVGASLLVSCGKSDEGFSKADALDLKTEAAMDVAYEDVDIITEAGMGQAAGDTRVETDGYVQCAVVTHDLPNKTITIDFGDGCTDPRGRVREGKIIVQYNDHRYVAGAYRIVTFEDFFINGVGVEGTRTVTNTSEEGQPPSFTISLVGGRLDFGDGTYATRESERVRTWYRGVVPANDYVLVTGSSEGVNRDGAEYSVEVLDALRFNRNCIRFIPVSGKIEITVGEVTGTVDFGDGTCDNIVTITIGGKVIEKRIVPRGA